MSATNFDASAFVGTFAGQALMISSLRGRLLACAASSELLIEVCGVGYSVHTTPSTALKIGEIDAEVFVYVQHIVREDAELLYGFITRDECLTFEALTNAHRVGPSLALAILDVHTPEALRYIVANDDVDALCLVSGVGAKTAARLLVELKSKLEVISHDATVATGAGVSRHVSSSSAQTDVYSALVNLGYEPAQVRQAVAGLPDSGSFEELIREALQLVSEVSARN